VVPGEMECGEDSRAASVPRERRLVRQRSAGEWRRIRVGLALVMATLGLLGGWALWLGIHEHLAVAVDQSRIAVLPFIDLSAEANHASFVDGMTQELIAQLAQTHGLTVIARTSVMKYKGTLKDMTTVGRELRVGRILQGSVRTVDNQIRISAELIDVASQGHLWSQEYDRELTGGFGIQSDIATRLAQSLRVQLTAAEKRRADLPAQAQHAAF
jgi:TolB-like protein